MLRAESISKSYGARVLFDRVDFTVGTRERVGLVGRNGHGKTTLFRLIAGEEQPDGGNLVTPRHYRVGYVRQQLEFTRPSILEEAMTALPPGESDHHWKAEKVLAGLGFSRADLARPPAEFSGGYQVRLNLAKALISEPDLLLLDEPTNFLDITSIRWVERFLIAWPRELLVITHDRSFMDRVVTHVMGIHRQKVRKIAGTTDSYYGQIAQDEEIYEKTRLNDERRRKEVELFITRFRAKARLAGLVQSRVKALQKMEKRDKLEQLKDLEFAFREKPLPGKHAVQARHLTFGYDPGRPLLRDLSITITAGERVAIVGPNGKGKTTLLKLLAGALSPDSGEVLYHPAIQKGFFEQTNVSHLIPNRTVEEEILNCDAAVDRQTARNICGAMLFSGDDALKKIAVLSGGEQQPRAARADHRHPGEPAAAGRAHQPPGPGVLRRAPGGARRLRGNAHPGHPQRDVPARPGRAADRLPRGRGRAVRRQVPGVSGPGRVAGRAAGRQGGGGDRRRAAREPQGGAQGVAPPAL